MTKPTHASLFWESVHAGYSSSLQNDVVWNLVLPGDSQDMLEATHVEDIELSFMLKNAQNLGLTAVKEGAHDTSSVELDLRVLHQLAIDPYSLG